VKRHRFDPFSFLFGALFVTVGASAIFAEGAGAVNPGRLWAIATVAAGGTLVAWVVTRSIADPLRRREDEAGIETGSDAGISEPGVTATDTEPMPVPPSDGPER
jgi:hypothetical protein